MLFISPDPKPYTVAPALLKSHMNHNFCAEYKIGWEDLALGGLDIV